MRLRQRFRRLQQYLDVILKYAAYISALLFLAGLLSSFLSSFFDWGKRGLFEYLRTNLLFFGLMAVGTATVTLWIWTSRLHRRFVSGFADDFGGNLRANWDFEGPWRIPEEGTLLVTGSDAGGITKVGAQWENYTFTFKARILNDCLGVVVRARDLTNYYMFQIRTDQIRPHRRAAVPVIEEEPLPQSDEQHPPEEAPRIRPIKYFIGWQIFEPSIPLSPKLDGWFDVKVVVRGESILLYIDDQLQFQRDSFLKIATGKVGFRNAGSEEALVRRVRVTLQT